MTMWLVTHLMSCGFMTGLIWLVQLVHYPSFAFIGEKSSVKFHQMHVSRITWIVGPMMVLELISGIALLVGAQMAAFSVVNMAFLILIWTSTALVSVPIHNKLAEKLEVPVIQKLVTTNWIRTICWTGRFIGLWYFAVTHFQSL